MFRSETLIIRPSLQDPKINLKMFIWEISQILKHVFCNNSVVCVVITVSFFNIFLGTYLLNAVKNVILNIWCLGVHIVSSSYLATGLGFWFSRYVAQISL